MEEEKTLYEYGMHRVGITFYVDKGLFINTNDCYHIAKRFEQQWKLGLSDKELEAMYVRYVSNSNKIHFENGMFEELWPSHC